MQSDIQQSNELVNYGDCLPSKAHVPPLAKLHVKVTCDPFDYLDPSSPSPFAGCAPRTPFKAATHAIAQAILRTNGQVKLCKSV